MVKIKRPDGTVSTFSHDYSNGCTAVTPLEGQSLTSRFLAGKNVVTVILRDTRGGLESSGPFS